MPRTLRKLWTAPLAIALIAGGLQAQERTNNDRGQRDRPSATQSTQEVEIPFFLKELDLTSRQQQEIRGVLEDHNTRAGDLWDQIMRRQAQAVEVEANLLAAARLATHDHEAHHQSGDADSRTATSADRTSREDDADRTTGDAATRSRNDAETRNRDDAATRNRDDSASRDHSERPAGQSGQKQEQDGLDVVMMRISVVQPSGGIREYVLSSDDSQNQDSHRKQCEVCSGYHSELQNLWKEIHSLHQKLVETEADRIVAVESKLTQEQIDVLGKRITETRDAEGPTGTRPNSSKGNQ